MEDETRKTIYGERNKGVEEGRGIRGWKKEKWEGEKRRCDGETENKRCRGTK